MMVFFLITNQTNIFPEQPVIQMMQLTHPIITETMNHVQCQCYTQLVTSKQIKAGLLVLACVGNFARSTMSCNLGTMNDKKLVTSS